MSTKDLSGNKLENKSETKSFSTDNTFNPQTVLLGISVLILYFILNTMMSLFFASEDVAQQSTKASFIDFVLLAVILGGALIKQCLLDSWGHNIHSSLVHWDLFIRNPNDPRVEAMDNFVFRVQRLFVDVYSRLYPILQVCVKN
jgi:hypothetical protein